MNNKIAYQCGIQKIDNEGRIILTKQAEDEVKALCVCELKNLEVNMFKRCVYCYNHLEEMNDFCEVKEKETLCFDSCDQFERKITVEQMKATGYFRGFELNEDGLWEKV